MIAWTIAGSDSGGGAGIQADLSVFQALGVHGCSVITALTAQNTQSVTDIYYVPSSHIAAEISALKCDLPAKAIKVGMVGSEGTLSVIQEFLQNFTGKVVLDPVMVSSSGKNLFSSSLTSYLTQLQTLFPFIDVITPNILEAELLTDTNIKTHDDMECAAYAILKQGVKSVLIKGGHLEGKESLDYWSNGQESFWIATPKINTFRFHGTGCLLSSAITACLALGYDMKDAITIAKMFLSQSLREAKQIGKGQAILKSSSWPEDEIDLPKIALTSKMKNLHFQDCGVMPLGLYPVVDSVTWLKKLLPLGIKTIQLRIKNKNVTELRSEIKTAIQLAEQYQARLFINDYWQLAIELGAYGVHLGQEDLDTADCEEMANQGLRLGISTHGYYEVARAHCLKPSYIACGTIYPTTSKIMPTLPQGLMQLQRWRRTLSYPLVAIGGINKTRFSEVAAARVSGIAMISAITQAPDPIAVTEELLRMLA